MFFTLFKRKDNVNKTTQRGQTMTDLPIDDVFDFQAKVINALKIVRAALEDKTNEYKGAGRAPSP